MKEEFQQAAVSSLVVASFYSKSHFQSMDDDTVLDKYRDVTTGKVSIATKSVTCEPADVDTFFADYKKDRADALLLSRDAEISAQVRKGSLTVQPSKRPNGFHF